MKDTTIHVAILDLYNNEPNQGMRCLKEIVSNTDRVIANIPITYRVLKTRSKAEVPDTSFDIYISSGGPGSPFEGEGTTWEKKYFQLIEHLWNHNQQNHISKKYVFFICHSFQMMCRLFTLAHIRKRNMRSFGIIPICNTPEAKTDPLFSLLPDVYYAADFRQYEVVQPDMKQFQALGGAILSIEGIRKNPAFERALMAVRLSGEMVGTQFHPEADPKSMLYHFQQPERKQQVIAEYGEERYREMINRLEDPDNILLTRKIILPRFLIQAIRQLRSEEIALSDSEKSLAATFADETEELTKTG